MGLHARSTPSRHRRAAASAIAVLGVLLVAAGLAVAAPGSPTASSGSVFMPGRTTAMASTGVLHGPALAARAWRLAGRSTGPALARSSGPTRIGSLNATPCGQTPGLLCSDVVVPLDRSGQTPGTVTLKVQVLPSAGPQRGVMFLVAGGPGQGSATVFGLGNQIAAENYRFLFPGYTLVAFDNRGTGGSGLLRCPGLQVYYPIAEEPSRVAACATAIGPGRVFYSTREHAEDLEAVRQAIGAQKVGVWGTSYGTKLAVAYALAHPANVERLLLDSVVETPNDDPYDTSTLREMPKALNDFCTGGVCRGATSSFASDVATVANRAAAKPVRGKVLLANGRQQTLQMDGLDVLHTVVDADLNQGLAAELPAVMHAARLGDMQPLLRMFALDSVFSSFQAEELSVGLLAATVCNDGPVPWPADAPVATREALYQSAVAALPANAFGPFGKWAGQFGNGHFCIGWPPPTGNVPLGTGPLPNVPVLAVNGGFDMRTPAASASLVASKFPQGRVLVVGGVGHSVVLGSDYSFCSARAVRSWILGEAFGDCARPRQLLTPVPAYPAGKRSRAATPRETLAAASKTLREAEALWLLGVGPGDRIAGLYSGRIVGTGEREFTLQRYSITPGIELSGTIRFTEFGPPLEFDGVVKVGGKWAATGLLGLDEGALAGTLGGQIVG